MKRQIKFRGKMVNVGEWVKIMTISFGTIKRKCRDVFFDVDPTDSGADDEEHFPKGFIEY